MKKSILFFALILIVASSFSQNWCPPGAKWHFKRAGTFSNCDVDLVYNNDTTVLGILCKKLVSTLHGQIWYSGPNSPVYTQYLKTYITYQSNGVLFLFNDSKNMFDTVVNFNATIGDTWLRPDEDTNFNACLSRWAFTVIDTARLSVNGFNLKKITVTNPSALNSNVTYTNVFLERILFTGGGGDDYYNLFPTYCEPGDSSTDAVGTAFRCYEDNFFPTYNVTNGPCKDFPTGLKPNSGIDWNFGVFTNPNDGSFQVDLEQPMEIRIYDMFGGIVYAESFKERGKRTIDAGHIAHGVYVLKAKTAEGQGQMKFIRQ